MFSSFKRNRDKIEIPAWASFFNTSEYKKFIDVIQNYFYSKNVTYTFGDGAINIGPNDFGFGVMGLVNVAQVCKQSESQDYHEIIKEHFDSMIRTYQFDKEFKKTIYDYDQIKQYIGVRLYPIDYFSQVGKENILGKDFSEDVFATLIFDLPDSVQSIKPEETISWDRTFDELFEVGLNNVKTKYSYDISQQQFNGFNIWFVQGDHFFSPNILLELENYPNVIGSKGSLIGLPHRHAIIIYSIEDFGVIDAINALIPTIKGMYEEGPGSLSEKLFWYNGGEFKDLPYKIDDDKIQFYPPEDFVNLLNDLNPE